MESILWKIALSATIIPRHSTNSSAKLFPFEFSSLPISSPAAFAHVTRKFEFAAFQSPLSWVTLRGQNRISLPFWFSIENSCQFSSLEIDFRVKFWFVPAAKQRTMTLVMLFVCTVTGKSSLKFWAPHCAYMNIVFYKKYVYFQWLLFRKFNKDEFLPLQINAKMVSRDVNDDYWLKVSELCCVITVG